jgi:hypothetical protein
MVLAFDRTDEGSVARRDDARAAHSAAIRAMFEAGSVVLGAGILDEDGVVRGSLIVTDHPDRAAVDAYLEAEPFQVQGVWERVEVHPLRVPELYLEARKG